MPKRFEPGRVPLSLFGGPRDGETMRFPIGAPAIAILPEGCEDGFYVWHPSPYRYEWVSVPPLEARCQPLDE